MLDEAELRDGVGDDADSEEDWENGLNGENLQGVPASEISEGQIAEGGSPCLDQLSVCFLGLLTQHQGLALEGCADLKLLHSSSFTFRRKNRMRA